MPEITDPVTINGYTQPGAAVNTSATAFNGTVLVRIAGASAGAGANGLTITTSNCLVRGLMITGFTGTGADGIEISGPGGNTIEGCLIGIDAASADQGNAANGVFISGAPNNLIGGTTTASRNVISGNQSDGVEINGAGATGNQVLGNLLGTSLSGVTAVANTADGILVTGAGANFIGSAVAGGGNLISGNGSDGIELTGLATTNTTVLGNRIGTETTGGSALANGVHGVNINTSSRSNVIGGVLAGYAVWWLLAARSENREAKTVKRTRALHRFLVPVSLGIFVVLLAGALVYPWMTAGKLLREAPWVGIAGVTPREKTPDGAAAIAWLRAYVPSDNVVLEAVGGSYDNGYSGLGFGQVSGSTGLATVLGWPGHEDQWRGGDPGARAQIEPRKADVTTIYSTTDTVQAADLLQKYSVDYIYVGEAERATYPAEGLAKFAQLADIAFQQGDVIVYKVR